MTAQKKIYTRKEFEELRVESAKAMHSDNELHNKAIEVLTRAHHYNWIHQSTWFGEPILNLPQDMFALQEIIFKTKPKYIVEVGVAWGGSLLFYSTIMEMIGGESIIGINIFIPDDLRERINEHGKIAKRISLINGSSIEDSTLTQVKSIIKDSREVMIILDSHHTHEHVLEELRLYSTLVGKGHYLICGDTIIEDISEPEHRMREWGHGNNPKTALVEFMKENDRFIEDKRIQNKLLFTCNPGGYLMCDKD
ncbi:MAG: hypothetical protein JKX73_04125 [Flavobacteriales bacterium]|nr:hypothetical protein [Flavobacteriales bacterium]